MSLQVQVSAATIQGALEEVIADLFAVPKSEISQRSRRCLGEKATEIRTAIRSDIIAIHLLKGIIEAALEDVECHAIAIDQLSTSKACLLHVRHIEEMFTVVKFILSDPTRYEELSWRWQNYSTVHAIRNRLLNLKTPIDGRMQEWVDQNLDQLKQWVDKRFVADAQQCIKQWEKYGNWLHPISLKEIFEKTDRTGSYISAEYDWNSHAVHFSPLADHYYGMKLEHHTYAEFATASALRYLLAFCRECLAVVSNRERLRTLHARNIFLDVFRMLDDKPQWYIDIANKGGRFAQLTNFLLSTDRTIESAIVVALGQEPEDPLVIRLDGG